MPKPFALVSSSDIKRQEFLDVVRAVGGVIEDAKALQGRISQGERHVWVALDNGLLNEYEADEIELMHQKLGGRPQSCILLDVSRTAGSERLALEFAGACAERWPCAVYNLLDKVISAPELLRLRKTAKEDLPL
jgi:hypothetical protein